MEQQFIKGLKRAKSEIESLKIAHNRGIGLIDFYRKTASWTVEAQRAAVITAVAKEGAPVPFFCQLASNLPKALELFSSTTVNGRTIKWQIYESYFAQGQTLTVEAISTVELESLTIQGV